MVLFDGILRRGDENLKFVVLPVFAALGVHERPLFEHLQFIIIQDADAICRNLDCVIGVEQRLALRIVLRQLVNLVKELAHQGAVLWFRFQLLYSRELRFNGLEVIGATLLHAAKQRGEGLRLMRRPVILNLDAG